MDVRRIVTYSSSLSAVGMWPEHHGNLVLSSLLPSFMCWWSGPGSLYYRILVFSLSICLENFVFSNLPVSWNNFLFGLLKYSCLDLSVCVPQNSYTGNLSPWSDVVFGSNWIWGEAFRNKWDLSSCGKTFRDWLCPIYRKFPSMNYDTSPESVILQNKYYICSSLKLGLLHGWIFMK